ncbi:MAG: FecR family protein [Bacteroidota bacterium]
MRKNKIYKLEDYLKKMNSRSTIHGENDPEFKEIEKIWQITSNCNDIVKPDTDKAWEKLKKETIEAGKSNTVAKKPIKIDLVLKVAATVLLLFASSFLIFQHLQKEQNIIYEFYVENGKKEVVLPDHSVVLLNGGSKISYDDKFNKKRVVNLEGEAFFNVEHLGENNFIINTREAQVVVLGTTFNVLSIPGKEELFVESGRVAYSPRDNTGAEIKVIGGEFAVMELQGPVKLDTINNNYLAWKTDTLSFDNTSLRDILSVLNKYFDVEISIEDKNFENKSFTGEFYHPDLEDLLKVITVSMKINYKKTKDGYLIY